MRRFIKPADTANADAGLQNRPTKQTQTKQTQTPVYKTGRHSKRRQNKRRRRFTKPADTANADKTNADACLVVICFCSWPFRAGRWSATAAPIIRAGGGTSNSRSRTIAARRCRAWQGGSGFHAAIRCCIGSLKLPPRKRCVEGGCASICKRQPLSFDVCLCPYVPRRRLTSLRSCGRAFCGRGMAVGDYCAARRRASSTPASASRQAGSGTSVTMIVLFATVIVGGCRLSPATALKSNQSALVCVDVKEL